MPEGWRNGWFKLTVICAALSLICGFLITLILPPAGQSTFGNNTDTAFPEQVATALAVVLVISALLSALFAILWVIGLLRNAN